MTEKVSPVWPWGAMAAVLALAADQASKWLIVNVVMIPPQLVPVTPFFNLTLGLNRGVSFGMLSAGLGDSPWILVALASVIVATIMFWLGRAQGRLEALGLGAIIGGALGNIVDRARLGGVVDFLDFYVGDWHWPAFNIADTSIATGAALVIASSFLDRRAAAQRA